MQKWFSFAPADVQNSRRGSRGELVAGLTHLSCWKDWMMMKHVPSSAASAEVMAANMGLTTCHTAFVFCVLWTKHLPGFYLGRINYVTTERKCQSQGWSLFPSSVGPITSLWPFVRVLRTHHHLFFLLPDAILNKLLSCFAPVILKLIKYAEKWGLGRQLLHHKYAAGPMGMCIFSHGSSTDHPAQAPHSLSLKYCFYHKSLNQVAFFFFFSFENRLWLFQGIWINSV